MGHLCYDNNRYSEYRGMRVIIIHNIVGYGDILPTSYFGRVCDVFICIAGQFFISLMIASIAQKVAFTFEQERVCINLQGY